MASMIDNLRSMVGMKPREWCRHCQQVTEGTGWGLHWCAECDGIK